jgi:excisionase family DNA binding protein
MAAKSETRSPDELELDRVLGGRWLFPVKEAARLFTVSVPTVYRYMNAGRVAFIMHGRARRITRPVVEKVLREGFGTMIVRGRSPSAVKAQRLREAEAKRAPEAAASPPAAE